MARAQSERTHCPKGHPYDEQNTIYSVGRRHCRQCKADRYRAKHPPPAPPTSAEIIEARISVEPDGCWRWVGAMQNAGYGQYGKPLKLAHRLAYETYVGPIPDGATIDHLCRNRACVNPAHLEAVSLAENVLRGESLPAQNARKTECPQGHPYDDENTYVNPKTGWRMCRTCNRLRARRRGLRRGG